MCETPRVEVLGEGLGVGNCRAGWRKPPGNSGVFFTDFVKQCRSKLSVCHPHTSAGVWKRFFSLPAVSPTLGSTVPASQAAFRAPSPAVNTNDSHPDPASHDPGADARAAAVADQLPDGHSCPRPPLRLFLCFNRLTYIWINQKNQLASHLHSHAANPRLAPSDS